MSVKVTKNYGDQIASSLLGTNASISLNSAENLLSDSKDGAQNSSYTSVILGAVNLSYYSFYPENKI